MSVIVNEAGIPIDGTLTANGNHALTTANEVKGGMKHVNTVAELDTIHALRRWEGMLAYVVENETYYRLKPSANWTFSISDWEVFGTSNTVTPVVEFVTITTLNTIPALTNTPLGKVVIHLRGWSSSDEEGAITVTGQNVVWNQNAVGFDLEVGDVLRLEYNKI